MIRSCFDFFAIFIRIQNTLKIKNLLGAKKMTVRTVGDFPKEIDSYLELLSKKIKTKNLYRWLIYWVHLEKFFFNVAKNMLDTNKEIHIGSGETVFFLERLESFTLENGIEANVFFAKTPHILEEGKKEEALLIFFDDKNYPDLINYGIPIFSKR